MSGRVDPGKLRFPKILAPLAGDLGSDRAYRVFTTMAACCISGGQREEEYLEEAKHLDAAQLETIGRAFGGLVLDMNEHPYTDLLGPYYMEIGNAMDKGFRGEFYTPHDVSTVLARLTMPDEWLEEPKGHRTLQEPSAGTGGMLLAYVEEMMRRKIPPDRVFIEAWDVSKGACDACFVNLALWGVPARIVWGDTLRMKVHGSWRTPFRPAEAEPDWTELLTLLDDSGADSGSETDHSEFDGRLFA